MLRRAFLAVAVCAFTLVGVQQAFADVPVNGYTKKDGTYVAPHWRSDPDGNPNNNWSHEGNVNPHTGQPGHKYTIDYSR